MVCSKGSGLKLGGRVVFIVFDFGPLGGEKYMTHPLICSHFPGDEKKEKNNRRA